MKFVDITNDIAFRKIFGSESKKASLISFLNAVLNFPIGKQVTDVTIVNPYQLPNLNNGKSTIVDVKAKDQQGNEFIVEMQVTEADFFHKRILYYTSQSYTTQIQEGKQYSKLKPVYFIGILEYTIGSNTNYYSRHKVLDVETKEHIIQDVEFCFIELPKFKKQLSDLTTSIDQWTYFIKNAENLEVIPESVTDKGLQEAYHEAEKHSWSKLELEEYIKANIKEQDDIGKIELAEKKAKIEGKIERNIEIAKALRAEGVSISIISKTTGLSEDEINNIPE